MKTLGQTICEARMAKKIAIRKFAVLIGLTATFASRLERDELPDVSEDAIQRVAEHLELDADTLRQLPRYREPVRIYPAFICTARDIQA